MRTKNLLLRLLEPISDDTVILHRNDPDAQGMPKFHPDDDLYLTDPDSGKNFTEDYVEDDMKKEAAGLDIPGQHSLSGPFNAEDFQTGHTTGFGGPSVIDVDDDKPPINNQPRGILSANFNDEEQVDYRNFFTFLETGLFEGMRRASTKSEIRSKRIKKLKVANRRELFKKFGIDRRLIDAKTAYEAEIVKFEEFVTGEAGRGFSLLGMQLDTLGDADPTSVNFTKESFKQKIASLVTDFYGSPLDSSYPGGPEFARLAAAYNEALHGDDSGEEEAEGAEEEEEEEAVVERRTLNRDWIAKFYEDKSTIPEDLRQTMYFVLKDVPLNIGADDASVEVDIHVNNQQDKPDKAALLVEGANTKGNKSNGYFEAAGFDPDKIPLYSDLKDQFGKAEEGSRHDDWRRLLINKAGESVDPFYVKNFRAEDGSLSKIEIHKDNNEEHPASLRGLTTLIEKTIDELTSLGVSASSLPSWEALEREWGTGREGRRRRSNVSTKVFNRSETTKEVQRIVFHDTDGDGAADESDSSEVDGQWWERTQNKWNDYFRRADTGSGATEPPATGAGTDLDTPEKALSALKTYTGQSAVASNVEYPGGGAREGAGYGAFKLPSGRGGAAGYGTFELPSSSSSRGYDRRRRERASDSPGMSAQPAGYQRTSPSYGGRTVNFPRYTEEKAGVAGVPAGAPAGTYYPPDLNTMFPDWQSLGLMAPASNVPDLIEKRAELRREQAKHVLGKLSRKESINLKRLQSLHNK